MPQLTGTPLRGGKRVQFNMFLKSINRITITENLTTVLMPAIWVEEVCTLDAFTFRKPPCMTCNLLHLQGIQLNGEMVSFFKKRLINTLKTLDIVHWAGLCGGIGVAVLGVIYYIFQRGRQTEAPVK